MIDFLYDLAEYDPSISNYIEILKEENVDSKIDDWVKADIEKTVRTCQRMGIKIILQNYPFYNNANEILKDVAEKYSLPFVDNEHVFTKLWDKGEKREDYFLPDAHCNDKGYRLTAENIYNKIIELNIFEPR